MSWTDLGGEKLAVQLILALSTSIPFFEMTCSKTVPCLSMT